LNSLAILFFFLRPGVEKLNSGKASSLEKRCSILAKDSSLKSDFSLSLSLSLSLYYSIYIYIYIYIPPVEIEKDLGGKCHFVWLLA